MNHLNEKPIPEWLELCMKCKHLKIYKRCDWEAHCKRETKGCKFEEYKPKNKVEAKQ